MSDEARELAKTFDQTWSEFLRIEGPDDDTDANRKCLAARIVAISRTGEKDLEAISRGALIYMRALKAARAVSGARSNVLGFPSKPIAASSFGPEKVEAMAAAMELCLSELPWRISSQVRDTLSAAIMRAAADGKANAIELKEAGMRALKDR